MFSLTPTTAKDKYVHSSYDRMANMYLQSEYRKIIGLGEDLPREGLELQLVRGEAQQKTSLKFRSQVMIINRSDEPRRHQLNDDHYR